MLSVRAESLVSRAVSRAVLCSHSSFAPLAAAAPGIERPGTPPLFAASSVATSPRKAETRARGLGGGHVPNSEAQAIIVLLFRLPPGIPEGVGKRASHPSARRGIFHLKKETNP